MIVGGEVLDRPPGAVDATGWFADRDPDPDGESDYDGHPWQPVVQVPGMCLPLPVWFSTEDECTAWIAEHLVGAQALP